ncbi:uncharacterized protein LOC111702017 [Eurytemora carolleeae]|uniref:uncharacterized protein LOC111702017 n=1 Tax=Eurytemora carolleeae TaxID=1294199 RepID=UPI000C75F717|nr:uncharacterized protein LOC111702017 [Eurytemora carolleeae]|eukprot:XP_023329304.1 uncharacterized protein LOC111702017 [Eurytemora affinis]
MAENILSIESFLPKNCSFQIVDIPRKKIGRIQHSQRRKLEQKNRELEKERDEALNKSRSYSEFLEGIVVQINHKRNCRETRASDGLLRKRLNMKTCQRSMLKLCLMRI